MIANASTAMAVGPRHDGCLFDLAFDASLRLLDI